MKKRNSITLFLLLGLLMGALAFGRFAAPAIAASDSSVYDDDDDGDYDDDDGGDYDDDDGDYDDDDGGDYGDYDDDDGGDYDDDDGGDYGDYDDDDGGDYDDDDGGDYGDYDDDDSGDYDDDDDWDDDSGSDNGAVRERYGRIDQRPSGTVGTWIIGGTAYTADNNTWVSSQNGSLSVGSCVEVKYRTANNTLIKIEAEREHECSSGSGSSNGGSNGGGYWNDTAERYGFVNTMPANPQQGAWVINGVTYTANAQTWINQQHGALRVGSCVEIKYRTADNTLVKIEVEHPSDCTGSPH